MDRRNRMFKMSKRDRRRVGSMLDDQGMIADRIRKLAKAIADAPNDYQVMELVGKMSFNGDLSCCNGRLETAFNSGFCKEDELHQRLLDGEITINAFLKFGAKQ